MRCGEDRIFHNHCQSTTKPSSLKSKCLDTSALEALLVKDTVQALIGKEVSGKSLLLINVPSGNGALKGRWGHCKISPVIKHAQTHPSLSP